MDLLKEVIDRTVITDFSIYSFGFVLAAIALYGLIDYLPDKEDSNE